MALRRPLVQIAGRVKELPTGDTLPADAVPPGGGSQQVFVQETRPAGNGPWIWWKTDATGRIIGCVVANGVA